MHTYGKGVTEEQTGRPLPPPHGGGRDSEPPDACLRAQGGGGVDLNIVGDAAAIHPTQPGGGRICYK